MIQLVRSAAARLGTYWRIVTRGDRVVAEMRDEMGFHVELETERLMREQGLPPEEARRRALVSFGGVGKYTEAGRDVSGLRWLDAIVTDSRFGARMLVKHRGLSIVGVFAMAVAIAVGATVFESVSALLDPTLPFPGGARVVSLKFVGSETGNPVRQVIHEYAALRGHLATVEQFGAYRTAPHNLVAADTAPEPVAVAEITASAFAIGGTPALLGRYLLPSDEPVTAAPVLVIGYDAWQTRFGADANVVGRTVTLGGVPRTIVGVMPRGFKFPIDHQFWVPLADGSLKYARWEGPAIYMFGRLAPGVTIDRAQAEFAARAQRTAEVHPRTGQTLRPVVVPYTREQLDPFMLWMLRAGQLLVGALTLVVAVNLAILVYARTVSRLGEIAVRSALGASRNRILAQLFIEALTLALVGAAAGLGLARYALDVIQTLNDTGGGMPFWVRFALSPGTVIYALALAVLAAIIMGVLPGLKATGASVNANLHELHGRGATRLGATWTTLIVAQVAIAVAVLPVAVFIASRIMRVEMTGPGFDAGSIVVANARLSPDAVNVDPDRITAYQADLITRLKAEPGVAGVAFSSALPGFGHTDRIRFEDGVRLREFADHIPDTGFTAALMPSVISVSVDLFDAYGVPILAGRRFRASDVGPANVVIVNRSFADMYLQDGNPLGLRFRYLAEEANPGPDQWFQIVGVVRDFPAFPPNFTREGEPTIYHPARVGNIYPVIVSVRFAGGVPAGFINRFREIGAEVDPTLQLRGVEPLTARYDSGRAAGRSMAWAAALITASVLLLSAAGIYALLSFTVAQRTREIGIRTALGAQPRRVLLDVFRRAGWQVAAGVIVGSFLSAAAFVAIGLGVVRVAPLLLVVAAIMALVGLLAAFGPARRAVRIQTVEALRADT
jgi:predicted permease